jgi:hypothetical protein
MTISSDRLTLLKVTHTTILREANTAQSNIGHFRLYCTYKITHILPHTLRTNVWGGERNETDAYEHVHVWLQAFTQNKCAKSSREIRPCNVELKTNVSETFWSVTSGSVWWMTACRWYLYQSAKSMPLPIGALCRRRAESYCAVIHPTVTCHHVA